VIGSLTGTLSRSFSWVAEKVDRSFGWSRMPRPLGLLVLIGLRDQLRARNLYDTGRGALDKPPYDDPYAGNLTARTLNGTYNDLDDPLTGSLGSRFGRNVPPMYTYPEQGERLLDPSPRLISRHLLTRDSFQPATTLNVLAAAWIQFEVHDWFSHGTSDTQVWDIPLEDGDPWPDPPMLIERTAPDPNPDPQGPPAYVTQDTHWWDSSQIYGGALNLKYADALRSGTTKGRLQIDNDGLPPAEVEQYVDFTGPAGNFWVGLAILHSLFIREHNAICERLATEYPDLSDQELYDKARIINSALIAKIHTVDWTPAIIAHPTTVFALRANWFGVLGERFRQVFGQITNNATLQGIPGSPTNDHGVPYSLTEEFVAVYRMHPLIPDDFVFRSVADNRVLAKHELPDLTVLQVRTRLSELKMDDIFYSFGRSYPGAINLHNFPKHLQDFKRADGSVVDLAAIDILRVRERGVPRYNQFRRLLHLKPASSFEELTDNPAWAEELRRIYGDVERVDLMVGLYAEPKPKGFGFSDTAFRIFILMATRRLESDRFFTRDFRPEIYTQAGMDWVTTNTMRTVLLRHFPSLEPALRGVKNPFAPWARVCGNHDG
jgi:heme peroxidase